MVRAGAFAVIAVALGFAREPGCGGVDDPQGGKNAPCTRNSDCKSDLECSQGVCVDTSTPTPVSDGGGGGPEDAEPSDASDGGG